ncbi:hypothetical protein M8C13_06130 [Crossiella sp. SN42]|uniref:hypothetical protein n=1 Tax=Crossiella sp. SN42 TaxID=2944808 RepID=UPI00207D148D|nr:hypothetical protein [Crossiella sp. SN42]MCO1575337.1 hypothetical protein [Crossiella sp. SN42]
MPAAMTPPPGGPGPAEQSAGPGPARFGALVKQAARAAAAAPSRDLTGAVCALLMLDPRHHNGILAVIEAILSAAWEHPRHEVTANSWRDRVPAWVPAQLRGAATRKLLHSELLVPTGRYEACASTATGRNGGKLQPVYRADLGRLGLPAAPA